MRQYLIQLLKILVAVALITYLVLSGDLDWRHFRIYLASPMLFLLSFIGWAALVGLGSVRWWVLLKGVGIEARLSRVIQLNFVGMFFNSTLPGAVGGDIIKAVYVMRDQGTKVKTPAMMTILLDRIVGLIALFMLGGFFSGIHWASIREQPKLVPLVSLIAAVCVGSAIFLMLVFGSESKLERTVTRLLQPYESGPRGILRSIWTALLVYKSQPMSILYAILISIVMQSAYMMYFAYLTYQLEGSINIEGFCTVYPIGILMTAIPLAPAGLGVGHVAFEQLYKWVGMNSGANVFNLYVLIQLVFNLSGVVPYLMMRKDSFVAKEA
jgi:uncharacterized protein (TIRG00374 family)